MSSISCIIVSYNNGTFLKQAILSVVNQSMSVSEIIVADDGSTDGSRELIASLAQKYNQIIPIFREKNLGVALNRDLAIRSAEGYFITTLDGDDFFFHEKIEKEFQSLQRNKSSIAYSDIRLISNDDCYLKHLDLSNFCCLEPKERLKWLANRSGPIPRDMLFSKQIYLDVGGTNHQIPVYEDWDLKIRLAAHSSEWIYSGISGIAYRQTGSGLSSMNLLKHIKDQYQVLSLNSELLKKQIGYDNFLQSMARIFTRGVSKFIKQMTKKQYLKTIK